MKSKASSAKKELMLRGIGTSPGIAIGSVYAFHHLSINLSELEIKVDDIEREFLQFDNAIRKVREQLEYIRQYSLEAYHNQFTEIFDSQIAFLHDQILIGEIKQEIERTKHSSAYVVSRVLSEKSDYLINLENTYFRERAFDVMDLKQKLINALLGIEMDYQLTRPSIVVAEMLTPSDTIHFNRNFLLGFLTDKGGKTSHSAIMARGLRIPSVVNGYNLSKMIQPSDRVIIDGAEGSIIVNPTPETEKYYEQLHKEYQEFEKSLAAHVSESSETLDGQQVELLANIEFLHEIRDVKSNRAQGIGLFRTESMFIEKGVELSEEEQFAVYKQLCSQMSPREVTIRTIDLGGDKLMAGFQDENEMNPFMGWRAIRFCLDRPDFFKIQLRAILRAAVYGKARILLPMISSIEEIIQTQLLIREVKEELTASGQKFNAELPIGIMVETPAAASLAKFFVQYVDFFSIGTNDLTQYVLAIDRTNEKVSKSYNTFNPAVLDSVASTIKIARNNQTGVTICGEFAATPAAIPLLLGMGLRSFSMNPHALPEAKKIIRSMPVPQCERLYKRTRSMHTAGEIERECMRFIKKQVPDLKFI
jgi:phosphotransferase system enzyme I (PtsI)